MKLTLFRPALISASLFLLLAVFGSRAAVAPKIGSVLDGEGIFWFTDTGERSPVRFDHFAHQAKNPDCRTCHDRLFTMERGNSDSNSDLNSESMANGKYCGACHNGELAFSVKENCETCHKKPAEP
jgi:c(7)-type cytochrome triheme protein